MTEVFTEEQTQAIIEVFPNAKVDEGKIVFSLRTIEDDQFLYLGHLRDQGLSIKATPFTNHFKSREMIKVEISRS